jgi:hypothetical protein
MSNYKITVTRGKSSGKLTYSGGISFTCKCWWDLAKKIPAATYAGCSATTMTTKKNSKGQPREAIFIPNVKGFKGIFIHMGTSPNWSDGCVVISEPYLLKIYNDVHPKNKANVTVAVMDG